MSSTLVDSLTDIFRSQALGSFAARYGESEPSVLRGFETSIGTMIAGLSSKLGQAGFARQLLDLINNPANDTKILQNARGLVEGQPADSLGSKLTSMLFGGNLSAVTDTIGSTSGLRGGTAASLMSLGAPLLLGSLVQRVRGMDTAGLTKFFSDESARAGESLPRGVWRFVGRDAETVPPVASGVVREPSRGWLWPLLAAAALILGLFWWFGARKPIVETVREAADSAPGWVTRTLPGNVDLRIPVDRMEDHLLAFLRDTSKAAGTAFDFDRLLFDTNSAVLQQASEEQLRAIATILRAFPNVNVKIGGYTDNTGDRSANQILSQQRADNVKQQLIAMGVSANRLEAQGYGEQYPAADNSTEEGRQRNRRISLHVTQK